MKWFQMLGDLRTSRSEKFVRLGVISDPNESPHVQPVRSGVGEVPTAIPQFDVAQIGEIAAPIRERAISEVVPTNDPPSISISSSERLCPSIFTDGCAIVGSFRGD
jgi:hypothetical protein